MNKLFVVLMLVAAPVIASDYSGLYKRVAPSVVSIENTKVEGTVLGSGVFLDSRHVLTCAHMLDGYKDRPRVFGYPYGQAQNARVLGIDKLHDLALLILDDSILNTAAAHFALVDPAIGQEVLVVGNGLGLDWGATQGIISAEHRLSRNWIQTDATINPGNSGCPVFDRRGRVVGIAVARIGPSAGVPGYGFFIPVLTVKSFLAQYTLEG